MGDAAFGTRHPYGAGACRVHAPPRKRVQGRPGLRVVRRKSGRAAFGAYENKRRNEREQEAANDAKHKNSSKKAQSGKRWIPALTYRVSEIRMRPPGRRETQATPPARIAKPPFRRSRPALKRPIRVDFLRNEKRVRSYYAFEGFSVRSDRCARNAVSARRRASESPAETPESPPTTFSPY